MGTSGRKRTREAKRPGRPSPATAQRPIPSRSAGTGSIRHAEPATVSRSDGAAASRVLGPNSYPELRKGRAGVD